MLFVLLTILRQDKARDNFPLFTGSKLTPFEDDLFELTLVVLLAFQQRLHGVAANSVNVLCIIPTDRRPRLEHKVH